MANIFRRDLATYALQRPKLMAAYRDNMLAHLQRTLPEVPRAELETFVTETIRSRLKRPKLALQHHPQYGVTQKKVTDLLNFSDGLTTQIITPGGAIYMPPSQKRSILSEALDESGRNRNAFKKKQLEAAAMGDSVQEQMMKLLQASAKIFNNSIPGAMGTPYSFLYDLPGYNAITSGGRQCVKTGYSHVERMLSGTIYVTSLDDVINYVVTHLQACPYEQVTAVMTKYQLTYPSVDLLMTFFQDCLRFYGDPDAEATQLRTYLETLTDVERAFVFYAYGYRNLLLHNDAVLRAYLARFFQRDVPVDPQLDPKAIFSVESDLLAMAMSLNFDLIHREPKLDVAITQHPDGVRHLLAICQHMQACLEEWRDLWQTFFLVDSSLARLWEYPDVVRRCVLVSDTDSVIFTTARIVEWYAPGKLFSQDAYDINAFSVFIVSQSLEHLFGRMTAGLGVEPADRHRIKMKNEFYYPIFIRSPMAKHYIGAISIQEGKILPKPRLDIKGLNYRGSDLPAATAEAFLDFVTWTLGEITRNGTVAAQDLLRRVAEHEHHIYTSLMRGEKTFLATAPMRAAEEYSDPEQTDYFYYLLWQAVFQERFGEFTIPNKGYVIPLRDGGKCLDDPAWQEALQKLDPKMHTQLAAFRARYPKRSFSRIVIPPSLREVPDLFKDLLDIRRIIHANGRPFFLLARSLGCGFDDKRGRYIASDFIQLKKAPLDITI